MLKSFTQLTKVTNKKHSGEKNNLVMIKELCTRFFVRIKRNFPDDLRNERNK